MPDFKPDVFDRLTQKIENKAKALRRSWALSSLEKQIAKALMITDGHKKAGIKAGDARYISIQENVDLQIAQFCDKYQVDKQHIDAQIPGLKLLADLATPPPASARTPLLLVFGAAAGLTLIGIIIGYVQFIAHLITRIF
jgi:hypothetical protein